MQHFEDAFVLFVPSEGSIFQTREYWIFQDSWSQSHYRQARISTRWREARTEREEGADSQSTETRSTLKNSEQSLASSGVNLREWMTRTLRRVPVTTMRARKAD